MGLDIEIICVLLGAVLGFMGTLLYERIKEYYEKKEAEREVILELIDSAKKDITSLIFADTESNENKFYILPVKIPYWDGLMSSSKIQLIMREGWFGNLLAIYDHVKEFNDWHDLRTRMYFERDSELSEKIKKIEGAIEIKKTEILSEIEKVEKFGDVKKIIEKLKEKGRLSD